MAQPLQDNWNNQQNDRREEERQQFRVVFSLQANETLIIIKKLKIKERYLEKEKKLSCLQKQIT